MPRVKTAPESPSGGTAQYVLDRLVAERRISITDIARYISELPREITRIEERLRHLRDATAPATTTAARSERINTRRRATERRRSARRTGGNGKALGGTYGGLIRRLPKAEQAQYAAIKARDGIRAAIAALQARKKP